MVKIVEIFPKSVISKSGIYSIDYSINPYIGCQHGCAYCYARFMKKYINTQEEWGNFVFVKVNAPTLVAKELKRVPQNSTVLLSSVCDPYQPMEKKYELTRKILEVLLKRRDLYIYILTKSDLVLRDINVLKEFPKLEVGFTIVFIDEKLKDIFEPGAPPIKRRLDAMRILLEEGIRTYLFIAPMLPYITENYLENLIDFANKNKVAYVFFDTLNIKAGNWKTIKQALEKFDSSLIKKYEDILFSRNSSYYRALKNKTIQLCSKFRVDCNFAF